MRGWYREIKVLCVSPAGSGPAPQWGAPRTDGRGNGDRSLGNVPPGRSDLSFKKEEKSSPPQLGAGSFFALPETQNTYFLPVL